jgi:quercetin dioxygenase-like cupin family protein
MPYHRFEDYKARAHAIHLTTAQNRKIEGQYMFFCHVTKAAGTGSELHYHPNELLVFVIKGKANIVVGRDRRVVPAGTFVHIPPNARHSVKATEEEDMQYLYIKDQTWSMVGVAEDEALPDKAPDVEDVAKQYAAGEWPGGEKNPEQSSAILDGLNHCYYPVIDSFDAPSISLNRIRRVEGQRLAFEFSDMPEGTKIERPKTDHEEFIYLINGHLETDIAGEAKSCEPGDVLEIPKGSKFSAKVTKGPVRYASVISMPYLEEKIDQ